MISIDSSLIVPIISSGVLAQAQTGNTPAPNSTPGAPGAPATAAICPVMPSQIETINNTTERMMFMVMLLSVRYMSELKLAIFDTRRPNWNKITIPKLRNLVTNIATLNSFVKRSVAQSPRARWARRLAQTVLPRSMARAKLRINYSSAYFFTQVFKPIADKLIGKNLVSDPTSYTQIMRAINTLGSRINDQQITTLLSNPSDTQLEAKLIKRLKTLYSNSRLPAKKKSAVRSMMLMLTLLAVRYMSELKLAIFDTRRPKWNKITIPKLRNLVTNIATLNSFVKRSVAQSPRARWARRLVQTVLPRSMARAKLRINYASAYYFTQVYKPIADLVIGANIVTDPTSSTKIMASLNSLRGNYPAAIRTLLTPTFNGSATSTTFEERLAKQLINLRVPNTAQGYAFKVERVSPNNLQVKPGQDVTITLTGTNLNQATKITHPFGRGTTIPLTPSNGNKTLTIRFKVPASQNPATYALNLVAGTTTLHCISLKVLKKKVKVNGGGGRNGPGKKPSLATRVGNFAYTNPATAFPKRYGPIVGSDVWNAQLTAGFSSSALESQRDNVPVNLRAAAENSSLLAARLTLGDRHHPVPIVGRKNTLANAISGKEYKNFPSWFTLGANLQLELNYNPKDTVLGMVGIGTNFIFSPAKQLDIDVYGHYAFRGTDYIDPNRLLFSGKDSVLTGGIAFGSNLATKIAYLKLYAEYQNSWRSYSDDTYGFSFSNSGGDSAVNAGLQLALSLNRKFKSKGVPNLWLEANGTVAGKRLVPEYSEGVGLTGTTPENVMGWNILLTAQWLNIPGYKPYVGFRSSGQHQQGWDLMTQYQAIVGLDSKKLGRFDLRYTYTNNPVLHYGEQSHSVSLRYNLPILRQALFGEIQYDNIAGQHFGRGIIGIDLLRFFPTSK